MDTSLFTLPPLDGSLSIMQIYDFHLKHSAACPLFIYTCSDGSKKVLTWGEFVLAIHGRAKSVLEELGEPSSGHATVAVLAVGDSISYITQLLAIMRAGFVAFPISTRNSPEAVAHLLQLTGARHLYLSADPVMQSLGRDAISRSSLNVNVLPHQEDMSSPPSPVFRIHSMVSFEDLYDSTLQDVQARNRQVLPEMIINDIHDACVILHSSGTTSFPKAISYTHLDLLQFATLRLTGEMGKQGQVHAMHHIPMFHAMGITSLARSASAAMVIAVFEPMSPPIFPTPDRLIRSIKQDGCTIAPCVPTFLETWATDPEAVRILAGLRALIFAGGPLSQSTGDLLVQNGVQLHAVYGGTEVGTISRMLPDKSLGEDWQYFQFAEYFDPHLAAWDEAENVFELWALENKTYSPIVCNDLINGKRAYATKDLVVRHPTKPDLWRVFGRSDDQIMLSTGEKTNPTPIESIFTHDSRILGAVMFGRGRFNNGIILLLDPSCLVDPANQAEVEVFKDSISERVGAANKFAPAHSKIYREMILIADPEKDFEFTLKGSPRRHSILAAHSREIEKAYENFAKSTAGTDLESPSSWTFDGVLQWVLKLLESVSGQRLPANVDIFHFGLDSLHAVRLQNVLFNTMVKLFGDEFATQMLPASLVYQFPTAEKLAQHLQGFVSVSETNLQVPAVNAEAMVNLVELFTAGLRDLAPLDRPLAPLERETVILTGSTGSLGSQILAKLCAREDIIKIYALNRGDNASLGIRQNEALRKQGIDPSILDMGKVNLLTVDLTVPKWGIESSLYETMSSTVTLIIHTAWPVQFNYSLESFVPALQGIRGLVDFAYQCIVQPRFVYTSSVAVVAHWPSGQKVPAQAISDPTMTGGLPYGQAKWISEQILDEAQQLGVIKLSVLRVGQLSGAPNGVWNPQEWFPSVCQVGKSMGALPTLDHHVAWLPTDVSACFIVDVKNCPVPYLNLTHPTAFPLQPVMNAISTRLKLSLTSAESWIDQLHSFQLQLHSSTGDLNLKARVGMLLQLLHNKKEFPTESALDLTLSLAYSPSLFAMQLTTIGDKEIESWLKYWKLL